MSRNFLGIPATPHPRRSSQAPRDPFANPSHLANPPPHATLTVTFLGTHDIRRSVSRRGAVYKSYRTYKVLKSWYMDRSELLDGKEPEHCGVATGAFGLPSRSQSRCRKLAKYKKK